MKITLEALNVIEAIDRCGTFALAAKELFRVPSALTYTVNNLEIQLNIQIFDRSGHRAKLTPEGKLLLKEGRKLLIEAKELEEKIKRHQSGWEDFLEISYDRIIPFKNLLFLIESFNRECPGVALKFRGEILGGCWDALAWRRCTIAIGVSGDPPLREDLSSFPLGEVEFVFVVGTQHPLASLPLAIENKDILSHRIVAIADTSRGFLPRTTGLLPGQEVITVSTFEEKIELIIAGIGVGNLPVTLANEYIQNKTLVMKALGQTKSRGVLSVAWRTSNMGKAATWLIEQLAKEEIAKKILTF